MHGEWCGMQRETEVDPSAALRDDKQETPHLRRDMGLMLALRASPLCDDIPPFAMKPQRMGHPNS
jgi:hypothetical protein